MITQFYLRFNFALFQSRTYYQDPSTGAQLYKDASDGTVYEWDAGKSAWFPRIDEDFMAHYQMNYGFTKDGENRLMSPL